MLPVHSVVSLVLVLCSSLFVLLVTLVLNVLVLVVSVVLVLVVSVVPVLVEPVPTVPVLPVKPVRLSVVLSVDFSITVFDAEIVVFKVSSDDSFCCEPKVLLLATTVDTLEKLPADVDSDEDGTVEV